MGLLDELSKINDNKDNAVEETKAIILRETELALAKAAEGTYSEIEKEIKEKAAKFIFEKEGGRKVIKGTYDLSYTKHNYTPIEIDGRSSTYEDRVCVNSNGLIDIKIYEEKIKLYHSRKDLFYDFRKKNEFFYDSYGYHKLWLYKWDMQIEEPFLSFLKRYKVYAKPVLNKYGNLYFSKLKELCENNGVTITPVIHNKRYYRSEFININESFLYESSLSRELAHSRVIRENEAYKKEPGDDDNSLLANSRPSINYNVTYD